MFNSLVDRVRAVSLLGLTREAITSWLDNRCASLGAALAYYTLFSLAPLLLIAVSVAGLVFGDQAARGEIYEQLSGFIGALGAGGGEQLLASVSWPAGNVTGTLLGLFIMFIGATTVFAELQGRLTASGMRRRRRAPACGRCSGRGCSLLVLRLVWAFC